MRSLIISDIHLDENSAISQKRLDTLINLDEVVDSIILCGDNAELDPSFNNLSKLFITLLQNYEGHIAFVPGNHEFWGKKIGVSSDNLLNEHFPKLTRYINNHFDNRLTYLEKENLTIGNWTIAGTYGHFDFSLSENFTPKELSQQSMQIGEDNITVSSRRFMDWKKSDPEVCQYLVNNLEDRIKGKDNLILVTHGVPSYHLTGHDPSPLQDYYVSFCGSTRFSDLCFNYPIEYYFFGHSHRQFISKINNAIAVNASSGENTLNYLILDTETNIIKPYQIPL